MFEQRHRVRSGDLEPRSDELVGPASQPQSPDRLDEDGIARGRIDRRKQLFVVVEVLRGIAGVESRLHRREFLIQSCPAHLIELLSTDRKSTRLNSSHVAISYAVFCLQKKRH